MTSVGDASREYSGDASLEILGDPSSAGDGDTLRAALGDPSPAAADDLSTPAPDDLSPRGMGDGTPKAPAQPGSVASLTLLRAGLMFVCLLSACAEVPRSDGQIISDAYGAFETRFGAPGELCDRMLPDMHFEYTPRFAMGEACSRESDLEFDGCYWNTSSAMIIAASDRRNEALKEHELTHWLLFCSGIDRTGDPGHTHAAWRP